MSNLLSQDLNSQSIPFLKQLVQSYINSISGYVNDLSVPLLESLYLILYGLDKLDVKSFIVKPYPIPLQEFTDTLIISHLFGGCEFKQEFSHRVQSFQEKNVDVKGMKIKVIKEYSSMHTVGEKTKEENDKEFEIKEQKQISKIFPTYTDEKAWRSVQTKRKKEVIQLLIDWEFSCGRLGNELEVRFLETLAYEYHGAVLYKPLEIHIKSELSKYEKPISNFNFYKDPNPHEAMQAYSPLISLLQKLTTLSKQFPGHAILQELQYLTYKVLKKPLFTTPLMQIVAALDLIVKKVEDWESFAHEGISMKNEIQLVYCVLRGWRDLEIKSWQGLLEYRRRQVEEKDARLFLRLFRVIVIEKNTGKELYEVLDEYIRGSSLGVFEFRMNLLSDFIKIVENDQSLPIYHIHKFYSYFFAKYQTILSEYKSDTESRLNEILKLAKYKISSYLLWKDTVSKSHRQLNTVLNKYKTILKLSFEKEVLEKQRESYTVNILDQGIALLDQEISTNPYEDLCTEIFQRLEALKATPDQSLKRSALTDLFRVLKDYGFSPYYKKWEGNTIYSLPILKPPTDIDLSIPDKYFYGCIDKMTILQYSITKNNELIAEEKEKCLSYATDILNKVINIRHSLAKEFYDYKQTILISESQQKLVAEILDFIKSAKFDLWQLELDDKVAINTKSTSNAPISLFIPTNTIEDISKCKDSLNQLIGYKKYQNEALEYLNELSEVMRPRFESGSLGLYKSLGKLCYVILSIFISLFSNGFCLPVETVQEKGQDGDGTGLGEGRGNNEITDELEDEEQFGEQKNQEENKEEIGEGQGMDVREEFQGEDESAERSQGEDRIGEAEGNETLMDKDQEVRDADGEIRETANPETTDQQDMKDGILPEDRQGEIEDFEMQAKTSTDEENLSQSQEVLDVDKKEDSYSEKSSDNNENSIHSPSESQEIEDLNKSSEEYEEKDKKIEDEIPQEEEKKLEEFKNRDRVDYNKESYGNEDLKANTEKVIEGGEGGELSGSQQNIISKIKTEWSSTPQGNSEIGPDSNQASIATLSNIQIVNTSTSIENPEQSSLYTFDDSKTESAAAPSLQNNTDLPSMPSQQLKESSMHTLAEQSLHPGAKKMENPDYSVPKPVMNLIPFNEGNAYYANKPALGIEKLNTEPCVHHMEIIADTGLDSNVQDWLELEKITQKISQELCEQLRIILEPTKAKSFKGDYKTGKRINMKKVISYIASQFRKDKIWLRRTRETGRDYQVLIAIDDSYSMNQHGLGDIAKKGLVAIAQALNKLEVGQLAVAAIRQGLTLLQDFSNTFTPEQGAFVLSQLQFQYGRDAGNDLSYPNFVQQCYEFLNNQGTELQLVIVISDGRMNKNKVKPCLRKSQGIFYLFIIVDNQDSSILDMKSTSIVKIAGKNSVKVYPYLEDFPFEYYVVVQSPEFLVTVLADVLRQWFELLRQ